MFAGITRWHSHHHQGGVAASDDDPALFSLLALVRFPLMNREFLQQTVRAWPPLRGAPASASGNATLGAPVSACAPSTVHSSS